MALDDLDLALVRLLQANARDTYAEMGKQVGLSAPAVKRRIDRLREVGAIRGYTVRLDPAVFGWSTEAYVEIFCRPRTSPADIHAVISKYPEVVSACTVTGDSDAILRVRAQDVRHFEQVVERIGAERFVVRTRSVMVLSRLVDRHENAEAAGGG